MITATSPNPQRSMTRPSSEYVRRSRNQAPVAATLIPVVKKQANSICGQRTRTIGSVVITHQSSGTNLPSTTTWPSGTCIQLLLHRIQKDDNIVPRETMQHDRK